jgi:hypothetical protein
MTGLPLSCAPAADTSPNCRARLCGTYRLAAFQGRNGEHVRGIS